MRVTKNFVPAVTAFYVSPEAEPGVELHFTNFTKSFLPALRDPITATAVLLSSIHNDIMILGHCHWVWLQHLSSHRPVHIRIVDNWQLAMGATGRPIMNSECSMKDL